MDTFTSKFALITGGSSGIGLALACELMARGANIAILARRPEQLELAHQKILSKRIHPEQKAITLTADVADEQQINTTLQVYVQEHGLPDFLFNSAGVVHPANCEDLDINRFRWMMDINYFGTVHTVKALLPGMLTRGSGHIINVASMASFLGIYGYTAYCGSKYAVRGFSDALRSELKPRGLHVSIVFPPDTDTPQLAYEMQYKSEITKHITSTSGAMSAEAVAHAILKGVARKRYIITPGKESTLFYHAVHMVSSLVYPIMDSIVAEGIKKSRRKDTEV